MKTVKSILLIDDDSDDRDLFKNALSLVDTSVELECARNGVEALDQLNLHTPDIIFLDLNMPLMPGLEFLAKLKKTVDLNEIPVIIFTTSAAEKDIQETAMLDADEYIVKPDNFRQIVDDIRRVLETDWNKRKN
ncbi:MAG: response regulator [Bacteroidota bacterium]|nr:response regulator [Bacteroidota bacterium]